MGRKEVTWNWGNKQQNRLIRRKPSLEADGENAVGVRELAETYIRRGYTRQQAYARARKELDQPFRKRSKRTYRGGRVSPK